MRELQISKDISNIIKGISCLLIVAHHFCLWLDGKGISNIFIHFIGVRGGVIGVTIFFFLSAWGLSESQNRNKYPLKVFVKRRLSKVFIPLFITNVFFYSILVLSKQISFHPFTLFLTAFNLKYFDGVLWFCNTILIFYAIFYFAFLPNQKNDKITICLLASILYSVIASFIYPDAPFYVYSVVGFPLGMILALYKDVVLKISFWGKWSFCILFFLLCGALLFPSYEKLFFMNIFSFFIVFILVFIISITQRVKLPNKLVVLPFLGSYSYEIYLLHYKVLVPMGRMDYLIWYPLIFILVVLPLGILLKKFSKAILDHGFCQK